MYHFLFNLQFYNTFHVNALSALDPINSILYILALFTIFLLYTFYLLYALGPCPRPPSFPLPPWFLPASPPLLPSLPPVGPPPGAKLTQKILPSRGPLCRCCCCWFRRRNTHIMIIFPAHISHAAPYPARVRFRVFCSAALILKRTVASKVAWLTCRHAILSTLFLASDNHELYNLGLPSEAALYRGWNIRWCFGV